MASAQAGLTARVLVLALGMAATLVVGQPAQANDDPVLGTWNLVVDKSIYDPGPAPRSQTRTYEAHPDGVKATIVTINAAGESSTVEFVADYDQMEGPIVGSTTADTLVLVKLDPLLAEATVSHAGRPMAYGRRIISPDGRTMTVTIREIHTGVVNVAVYEREE